VPLYSPAQAAAAFSENFTVANIWKGLIMAKTPKSSEPFVSEQDRPAISPDTPLGQLRVRDLQAIVGGAAQAKAIDKTHKELEKLIKDVDVASGKGGKDFWDHEKHLKDIFDHIHQQKTVFEAPPDPTQRDPINQIGELQNMIGQLANEVAALKAKIGE
jgi:hypothetical protein